MTGDIRMIHTLRTTAVLALLLGTGACATKTAEPIFDPDPVLHPPDGRIVFNRMCADEEPYRVKAYARMESRDGRARVVAAVLAGYRATEGRTVFIDVRLQRLKLDAGTKWRNTPYTVRLVARGAHAVVEGLEFGSYVDDKAGERRFRTDETGAADWMTFVEPEDEDDDTIRFHRFGPELGFEAASLGVESPGDEFDLSLVLRNEAGGQILELVGPGVRVPERVWAMDPPAPRALGLLETLNPAQEGGLFDVLGRAWKYRKCIEERQAAKGFLGPYLAPAPAEGE